MKASVLLQVSLLVSLNLACSHQPTGTDASNGDGTRNVASVYDSGDDNIKIGSMQIPLNKDSNDITSDAISVSISDPKEEYCNNGHSPGSFTIAKNGTCYDVTEHGSRPEITTRYCIGSVLRADGRSFKITQVLDRCMKQYASGGDRRFASLWGRSPIIRLTSEDGKSWVTEDVQLRRLVNINKTHTVSQGASCNAKGLLNRGRRASACASEAAKKLTLQACMDMKGRPQEATLTPDGEPWMCYTEAFAEEYCAAYKMTCDF